MELFEVLPTMIDSLDRESIMALIYIAGYICRHDDTTISDTFLYMEKYGDFLKAVDRGGLKVPPDNVSEWALLCAILFISLEGPVCRNSLAGFFDRVAEHFRYDVPYTYSTRLCNIFLNNQSALSTPRSTKEPSLKILKLS